ncbi:hypothetical protein DAI22_10g094200 [Oryza sativa Japonica Group]|nr:hypothetical protein DAI22_10g094200 [Oryza sativa Japonica Group]
MFPSIFLSGCMHSMLAMQNPMYVNVILMLQRQGARYSDDIGQV